MWNDLFLFIYQLIYNSIASHASEAKDSTELELAEKTPKDESKKNDPLA